MSIQRWFRGSPLSCKRFAELMSRSLDECLRFPQRFSYWFHYAMCLTCRRVDAQVRAMESDLRQLGDSGSLDELQTKQLTDTQRASIKESVKALTHEVR